MIKTELKRMGERIRKLIKKDYRSLELFAYENEISKKTLYNIINGVRDPRLSTLRSIADGLEVSITEMTGY